MDIEWEADMGTTLKLKARNGQTVKGKKRCWVCCHWYKLETLGNEGLCLPCSQLLNSLEV